MFARPLRLILIVFALLSILALPSAAQDNEPINMLVEAGFDNFFRPEQWLPIQIRVQNDGVGFDGRLTVRPETSGRAVDTAYSSTIDLPTGSDKTVFLYVQVASFADNLLIELIDNEGVRVSEQRVGLSGIAPRDALHMVVSGTGANSIPLNALAQGGFNARQGRWTLDNLPPNVAALQSIDTLIFYDVQSDQMTIGQLEALETWVATGGHLIVIGGPSWTQTASGFSDNAILPFVPDGSANVDDVSGLAAYVGLSDNLSTRTFITTGEVTENSRILAQTDDNLAILIRRELGTGVVDYFTLDPTLEPLRSWLALPEVWLNLLSTAVPEPGWQRGLLDQQEAARALAILPGVNLLPPVTSMLLFIGIYILLIGPINYFVLSRMRRRAWAWLTIPVFILIFTILAWNVGFNLRGSELILSRLYVVQSFDDTEAAYQEELVGVLSPRRDTYTVAAPDPAFMQVLPGLEADSFFSANISRSTTEVVQSNAFVVEDIAIDGGIFANFGLSRAVDRPEISGTATITYITERDEDTPENTALGQSIRGVIRNDSEIDLDDAIILTRNQFYRLDGTFAAGDVLDFDSSDFELINETERELIPLASPFQSSSQLEIASSGRNSSINDSLVTSRVLLNIPWSAATRRSIILESDDEEENRRRAFLRAFMRDQYATAGIGHEIYLLGWSNAERPNDIAIDEVTFRPVDTTLYIIELSTTVETPPSSEIVTISPDQFTWTALDLDPLQVSTTGMNDLTLVNPASLTLQFAPIDGAILADVSDMRLELDRTSAYGNRVDVSLWHWETQTWEALSGNSIEIYDIDNIERYLGTDNMVRVRLNLEADLVGNTGTARIRNVRLFQTGNF